MLEPSQLSAINISQQYIQYISEGKVITANAAPTQSSHTVTVKALSFCALSLALSVVREKEEEQVWTEDNR